jgi:predicted esterase
MERPENFAGAISLCGPFPREDAPLARLSHARQVPLLIACGRDSQRYAAAQVCSDLRLLHSAGMDVTLRQYSAGHQLGPQMLSDVNRWIMERLGCR